MEHQDLNCRTLILHIGTEKTGSTSIQKFLHLNKETLSSNNIGVPDSLGGLLHYKLQMMANNNDYVDDFARNMKLHNDPGRRELLIKEWKDEFYKEVEASTAKIWIISCETLHSRLLHLSELNRLRELLAPLFTTINVLVYLRDPLSLAISMLNESVKCAVDISLPEPNRSTSFDIADHKATLERWDGAMGSGEIWARLFDRSFLKEGDVVKDFISVCKLDQGEYKLPSHENRSMSYLGIKLLNEINRYVPRRWIDGSLIKSRWNLVLKVLKHMQGGATYAPTSEEILKYSEYYECCNEWVRTRYFSDRKSLFSNDWRLENKTISLLSDDYYIQQIGKLFADIWLLNTAHINQLNAKVDYLQRRLENLENNIDDKQLKPPSLSLEDFLDR